MDQRQHQRRSADVDASRIRVSWNVVAWILGVVVSALVTYNATINSVRELNAQTIQRVLIIETRQTNSDQRLQRIEMSIDAVDGKVDRLLERR